MSLETILKEIKSLKPILSEDTDSGPVETLRGRRGRKTQAMERMKILRREYKLDLAAGALFIIVAGDKNTEFSEAKDKKGLLLPYSSDPESFYNDLANRVHPTLYQGKESVSNLFDVLSRYLEDKMNELDVNAYPQLIFKEKYVRKINNPEDFAKLVKEAVNEQIGSEIVGIQAIDSVLDNAIELGNKSQTTAITLNTNDVTLINCLLRDLGRITSRVAVVVAGTASPEIEGLKDVLKVEEVDAQSVRATLGTITKMFKR